MSPDEKRHLWYERIFDDLEECLSIEPEVFVMSDKK